MIIGRLRPHITGIIKNLEFYIIEKLNFFNISKLIEYKREKKIILK